MPVKIQVEPTDPERETLRSWVAGQKTEKRLADRARMILLSAEGVKGCEIARRVGVTPYVVSRWRKRFAREGVQGLFDKPRSGAPARYDERTDERVLAVLDARPPEGFARWNGPLVAAELGDVSADQVWRILRKHGIHMERRRSWCVSTDPTDGTGSFIRDVAAL